MKRNTLVALVLIVVAINVLWIAGNPPSGERINPFFLYLLFFGIGGFLVTFVLTPLARGFSARVGAGWAFATLGFILSMLEEVIAYLTRSGLYQDGKHALGPGLVHAGLPLFTWTLGVFIAMRLFAFGRLELFVISGLSGWMCEAIIGGLFFKQPLLAVAALPAIAFSYFVLIFLPVRAVEGLMTPGRASCWRIPAGLLIPAILWSGGGIAGALLVRAQ